MESFIIKKTNDTPEIRFTSDTNTYSMIGRSFNENPKEFYFPIYKKFEEGIIGLDQLTLESDLEYMNSSSVKMIYAIFNLLNKRFNDNPKGNYKIIWIYKSSDKLMEIKGQEFQDLLDLPFELVVKV